jgi:hypothetical protein
VGPESPRLSGDKDPVPDSPCLNVSVVGLMLFSTILYIAHG